MGRTVQPVLVFTEGRIKGDRIGTGRLPITTPTELAGLLRLITLGRIDAIEASRIREALLTPIS